jgi:hypothetical protein
MVTTAIFNYLKEIFRSYCANDSYVAVMVTITPIAQDKPEKSLSSTKLGKNISLSGDFDLAKHYNNDPIRLFEPKAPRRFGRIFTIAQEKLPTIGSGTGHTGSMGPKNAEDSPLLRREVTAKPPLLCRGKPPFPTASVQ